MHHIRYILGCLRLHVTLATTKGCSCIRGGPGQEFQGMCQLEAPTSAYASDQSTSLLDIENELIKLSS